MKILPKTNSGNFLNLCLIVAVLFASFGCSEFSRGFKEGYDKARGVSSTPQNVTGNPNSNSGASPNMNNHPTNPGDYDKPTLPDNRNGFSRDRVSPLKVTDYPNASDALIANYKMASSSNFVVIEAALYPSSDSAKDGFDSHLTDVGAKILEKSFINGSPYAYYKNTVGGNTYYHFCLQYKNQLMDYFAPNLEHVKAFSQIGKSGSLTYRKP